MIGQKIKYQRRLQCLTQAELAKLAYTQQTKISLYERGKVVPMYATISNIAAALKCKVSTLID